jgi:hypothetical protein
MKIELTISTETLGDNTAAENLRYVAAVREALADEYPDASICVSLVDNATSTDCFVSDDETGGNRENVRIIANQVWDESSY